MIELVKTKINGIVIDKKTKAVINTNIEEYSRIVSERLKTKQIASMQQEILHLSSELEELKQMIRNAITINTKNFQE